MQSLTTTNNVIDLQFDMNRICDGTMHREILSIPDSEFQPSLSYVSELIETQFNIPKVLQLSLTLCGVPLDCLTPDTEFSKRIWNKGERLAFRLEYYSNSVRLKPIEKMLAQLDAVLKAKNYRIVYVIMNSLNHEHINMHGWDSYEALGTRLFIYNNDFLSQLYNCILSLNQQLLESYNKYKAIADQDSSVSQEKLQILGTADSISTALNAALSMLWNLGAKGTDRILLFTRGFLELSQQSVSYANDLISAPQEEFKGIGRAIFGKCLGVIQGYSELRAPALKIGNDIDFLKFILGNILNPNLYYADSMEDVLQILMLFSCSAHNQISSHFFHYNFYASILNYFYSKPPQRDFRNTNFEKYYIVCLIMLNCLKSPLPVQLHQQFYTQLLTLFNTFFHCVGVQDIIDFENGTSFIWGTLEPFISYFFVHRQSIIGQLLYNSPGRGGLYSELLNSYDHMTSFCLDVLLTREPSRKQLLEENLLTFLIIAGWVNPALNIYERLKQWYPEISFFPVPSLYDIAATQVSSLREYEFQGLIHPSV